MRGGGGRSFTVQISVVFGELNSVYLLLIFEGKKIFFLTSLVMSQTIDLIFPLVTLINGLKFRFEVSGRVPLGSFNYASSPSVPNFV